MDPARRVARPPRGGGARSLHASGEGPRRRRRANPRRRLRDLGFCDPGRRRPAAGAGEGGRPSPSRGLRPHARRPRPGRAGRACHPVGCGPRPERSAHRLALHRGGRAVRIPVPPGERLGQRGGRTARRSATRPGCVVSISAQREGPTRSHASAVTRRAAPMEPARRRRTRSCEGTASGPEVRISAIHLTSSVLDRLPAWRAR
jgi:hypothetical protein